MSKSLSSAGPDPGPLCRYLDGLVDELRRYVPAALQEFEVEAIHKSRVTSRRIKAALDLLDSCLDRDHGKPFRKIGRTLRRRLGPLRDIDVMLDHLDELASNSKLEGAVEWMRGRMLDQRDRARGKSQRKLAAANVLARLGTWWGLRQDVIDAADAIGSLLAESLHLQLDRFIENADLLARSTTGSQEQAMAGGAAQGARTQHDPHQLRIAAKALRYTLELADAQGQELPGGLLKTFKQMQESLGQWHDFVVMAQRAMEASLEQQLPLHNPRSQREVLLLVDQAMTRAQRELDRFSKLWSDSGAELAQTIRETFPLTQSCTPTLPRVEGANEQATPPVSESQTDRGPADSEISADAEAALTTPPPAA